MDSNLCIKFSFAVPAGKEHFLNKANLIIEEVNKVLFDAKPAKEGVKDLMVREKRVEHLNLKWEN